MRYFGELVFIALISAYSVVICRVVPKRYYALTNVITAASSVLVAHLIGLSWSDIGLAPGSLLTGLLWGLAVSLPVAMIISLFVSHKFTRHLFRGSQLPAKPIKLAYEFGLRIPLGTALSEEIIFRGVLLGMLLQNHNQLTSLAVSAILFGLWHILPTLDTIRQNDAVTALAKSSFVHKHLPVVTTVLFTGLVGVAFGWLRIWAGSLLAPWVVHSVVNTLALGGGPLVDKAKAAKTRKTN